MAKKKKTKAPACASLLVEVLTEELPPKSLRALSETFSKTLTEDLRQDDFLESESEVTSFATPRRLAVLITRVRGRAPDRPVENLGPPVKVGLDANGNPTPALTGFARKHGVNVDRLTKRAGPKGEFFVYRDLAKGGRLETRLALKVKAALEALPSPKLMRWGAGNAEFVRPVHGLVMLHGSKVVPGAVMGLASSNRTHGHRFLGQGRITIKRAEDYERELRTNGKVWAGFEARRREIIGKLEKLAESGFEFVADDELFDEITALVEAPAVYAGEFSPEFLQVPPECLILSMQAHQKYVPIRDKASGKLLPRFLFVSNLKAKDASDIIHGNERVLHARLADAKFFYDQDRKTRLEARVPRLANVVYHNKLGSQLERVERIQLLAGRIAREMGADPVLAERAAWLSKVDLLTDMVGEFPELQGIMGRHYALHDGEPKQVADAIGTHYRPRFSRDALPDDAISAAVALADKLDALAGLFSIGEVPTGDKDPFGLRRAAIGVIRILVENDLPLALDTLVSSALAGYNNSPADARNDLESFIYDRLSGYLRDRGYSTLEVDSVISLRPPLVHVVPRQLEAVRAFNSLPEAESLAAANKRVANILRQAAARGETFSNAAADMLKEAAERSLFEALKKTSGHAVKLLKNGDFTGYLKSFAVLKTPVDAFFDSVMVMVDDPALRRNRLALLADLRKEMNRVADISKLAA